MPKRSRRPQRPPGSIQCCGRRGKSRCEREGTTWARLNWFCREHVDHRKPADNCSHDSVCQPPGQAAVCGWCCGTLEYPDD